MNARPSIDSVQQWLHDAAECENPSTVDDLARVRAKWTSVRPHLGFGDARFDADAPLDELEPTLDAVMERLEIAFDPAAAVPEAAHTALREGREFDAVYAYRRANGSRLIEALRVVRTLIGDREPSTEALGPH